MTEILFLAFFALLLMGMPVAFALGLASVAAIYFGSSIPLLIVPRKLFNGLKSFPFLAIPLFLLAGNIMAEAQISERLVKLAGLFLGRVPGGLAQMSTGASAFFGAISGSAPATTSAIGSILIPSMIRRGYPAPVAGAVVASSGALGLIIPPSLTMVVYGAIASVSIGDLFIAALVLLVPTLGVLVTASGIDLVYFGVFTVITLAGGNFTPPVELNLFIAAGLSGSSIEAISRSSLPYIFAYIAILILFILFPEVITVFR